MTTSKSPLRALQAQANKMAFALKAMQEGRFAKPPGAAVQKHVIFGVVMDDKVLKIQMDWETIRDITEPSLAAYILRQMLSDRTPNH